MSRRINDICVESFHKGSTFNKGGKIIAGIFSKSDTKKCEWENLSKIFMGRGSFFGLY